VVTQCDSTSQRLSDKINAVKNL